MAMRGTMCSDSSGSFDALTCIRSCRYNDLHITSDINVRYNSEAGEFKFSGSYGYDGALRCFNCLRQDESDRSHI
jgi:hypothetical protein